MTAAVDMCREPGRHEVRAPQIRRELRPGDAGSIARQHGRLYADEHRLDVSFEAHVARGLAAAIERGWPTEREGIWIVELDGEPSGSLALTDEGEGEACLRWFLLDPALRSRGFGHRLLAEALERAAASGYRRVSLETFSELRRAARLYRALGFEAVSSETGRRWGREALTSQRYALSLDAPRRVLGDDLEAG